MGVHSKVVILSGEQENVSLNIVTVITSDVINSLIPRGAVSVFED